MYKDVIGVLGGMGSYATCHFFEMLLDAFPAEKEWERPRIIIDNRCTMPSRVLAVLEGTKYEELVSQLGDSVKLLIGAGATKIILACNTSHLFLDDIYAIVPEAKRKIVNIIDVCCDEIYRCREKTVALIASEGTIQSQVFAQKLEMFGINTIIPTGEQYQKQRQLIETVKQNRITTKDVASFSELIHSFNTEGIILGCTEFSVLFSRLEKREIVGLRIYDPLMAACNVLKTTCK